MTAPLSPDQIVATDRFADERVCEIYRCDSDGFISVELRRPALNESRVFEICRD